MLTVGQLIKEFSEHTEVEFRANYSGRGMYGEQCVGIVGSMSYCMDVIAEIIKFSKGEENFDEIVDTLLDFERDNMAYDVILYWPGVTVEVNEEEEA